MDVYKLDNIADILAGNSYAGRGIVIGKSADGNNSVIAYFIMGRSNNSRNRVFVKEGDDVTIYPYDESLVEDPSLIIYSPIRVYADKVVVTNGDQTDTIVDGLKSGKDMRESLKSRCFEPDAPNLTPRISGILEYGEGDFEYAMSILKSADREGSACSRYTYDYPSLAGVGHFIHTYVTDGNPLPTFQGEPERVSIPDDIDLFTTSIWDNLDKDNRISLYVRYTSLESGEYVDRLINKHLK
ncbi:MAG: IMP cyclohydrolase [Clostridia bacterium]|nr:IMP cyclohydrolase [Clostridia bacterium]